VIGSLEIPVACAWMWLAFEEIPPLMTCAGGLIVMAAVSGDLLLKGSKGMTASATAPSRSLPMIVATATSLGFPLVRTEPLMT
jgi:hypothetical protein